MTNISTETQTEKQKRGRKPLGKTKEEKNEYSKLMMMKKRLQGINEPDKLKAEIRRHKFYISMIEKILLENYKMSSCSDTD